MSWDEALDGFDERIADAPPRRHLLVPAHRPDADQDQRPARRRPDETEPLSRLRELVGRRVPVELALRRAQPRHQPAARRSSRGSTRSSSRMLSARTYSDVAHKVFTSPRDRRVPRDGVRRARARPGSPRSARPGPPLEASDLKITFPVEIRVTPADDIPLSTSIGPRLLLPRVPHPPRRRPPRVLRAARADHARPRRPPALGQGAHPHRGRPGRRRTPASSEFLALRDRLDPDRVFANPYLRRVLGD